MEKYLSRSFRYFVYMVFLWAVILLLMIITNTADLSSGGVLELFSSTNGMLLIALVIGLSLLYPYFGYVKKTIPRIVRKKELIDQLIDSGMVLESQNGNRYIFRYANKMRRFLIRFDDKIVIDIENDKTIVEGNKVPVSKVFYRIESLTENE